MRWPSVSLTFLKRSRSMNSTPTRWPLRLACAIACDRRSCSSSRFGSPVSASRVARYCSRSSAWIRERHVLHERQDRHDLAVVVEQRGVVPLAPDRVAVLAVVAREARSRAAPRRSSACSTRPANASRSSSWTAGCRRAECRGSRRLVQPKMFSRLRRPAHEPEVAVPLQHRERRVADVATTASSSRARSVVLVALLVVDVGVHRVDADDVAFGVAVAARSAPTPSAASRRAATSCFSVDTVSPFSTRSSSGPQLIRALVADAPRRTCGRSGPCGSRPAIPRCGG